jgi:CarD family transcriptional regulator
MADFFEGQYVVYPAHGVGVIKGIETQEIAGTQIQVLVISFSKDKMVVRLPLNKSTNKKVRNLCSKDEMKEALDCLKTPTKSKKMMWSRRAQEYENKINSGDPVSIAQVIRDLHRTPNQPEHSYSERQIYKEALTRLSKEFAIVEEMAEDEALTVLEKALQAA